MTIILVSHSLQLANSVKKYLIEMNLNVENVTIEIAAGTFENGIGTDPIKILKVINDSLDQEILIICDLGSAVLSAELAKEMCVSNKQIHVSGGSFLEGAFSATIIAASGSKFKDVVNAAEEIVKK